MSEYLSQNSTQHESKVPSMPFLPFSIHRNLLIIYSPNFVKKKEFLVFCKTELTLLLARLLTCFLTVHLSSVTKYLCENWEPRRNSLQIWCKTKITEEQMGASLQIQQICNHQTERKKTTTLTTDIWCFISVTPRQTKIYSQQHTAMSVLVQLVHLTNQGKIIANKAVLLAIDKADSS